ncbi:Putative peptidoglycan binding domain-containing protein [Streptomyces sp. yr375]|uniref:peptidoglycan-binding domain-containing protein n=1 Tax=Streptomyces sp. yr375 TaxID=1761906 RepID=UPI0008D1FC56|nr:peptidoglycan-binding domain-containing protein [Streptomyces sp. yr375]SES48540.1 Putative peptidoglycan binding domain-containing protein [Streptomyces sp. yr375]
MIDPTGQQGRQGQQGRHGLPCPQCGALRAPDNTPSCSCARRAADALHDTRTTEAAAAEDFDPLRIRPYVELDDTAASDKGTEAADAGAGGTSDATDGEPTMPLQPVPTEATTTLPTPLAPPVSAPSTTDVRLFETADVGPAHLDDHEEPRRPRRRRALLVASSAAVVALVAAAGFASGLFSYEKPTRDGAAPEDVRAAVPDTSTSPPTTAKSPTPSHSASPSASDASPSPSETESPSPSTSEENTAPTTSPSPTATRTAPTARVTGSVVPPEDGADKNGESSLGVVLRRGDTGAEVTELQLRLAQLSLYDGAADGIFSDEVEDVLRNYQSAKGTTADGLGVYGPLTRAILESETKEPS